MYKLIGKGKNLQEFEALTLASQGAEEHSDFEHKFFFFSITKW
jgi:hypothetical protein